MPLSRYCKLIHHHEDRERGMLFSTRTAAVACVSPEVIQDIEQNKLSEDEKGTLSELALFTESAETEKGELRGFIEDLNNRNRAFNAIVVLNLNCNLACTYCFEGSRKGKYYLSAETADDFIDFIKSDHVEGKDEINLIFYGGEPLLSMDMIIRISENIRSIAGPRGIQFGFSLITNGTLLTPRVVEKLKPLGLKAASVTLDGPQEVHDAFRPFRSGKGSFDVITGNMKDIRSMIDVQVGGNFTRGSYRQFPRLLDYLLSTGLTPDDISAVRFDPVINESSQYALPDFHDGCNSMDEPWLIDAGLSLRDEILRRGYRTPKIMPSPCFMEFKDSVVVNYDGSLYKCPGLIGRKSCCVGDVKSGLLDYQESHALDNWKNEECLECVYLPLCFGGCRYMQQVRNGTMRGTNCRKEYFDRTLNDLITQDIKYDL